MTVINNTPFPHQHRNSILPKWLRLFVAVTLFGLFSASVTCAQADYADVYGVDNSGQTQVGDDTYADDIAPPNGAELVGIAESERDYNSDMYLISVAATLTKPDGSQAARVTASPDSSGTYARAESVVVWNANDEGDYSVNTAHRYFTNDDPYYNAAYRPSASANWYYRRYYTYFGFFFIRIRSVLHAYRYINYVGGYYQYGPSCISSGCTRRNFFHGRYYGPYLQYYGFRIDHPYGYFCFSPTGRGQDVPGICT